MSHIKALKYLVQSNSKARKNKVHFTSLILLYNIKHIHNILPNLINM